MFRILVVAKEFLLFPCQSRRTMGNDPKIPHFFAGDDATQSFPIFARMREIRPAASFGPFESLLRRKTSASWIASDFCKYIHGSLSKSINLTEIFPQ